ncbi:MAG: protease complex subunit PrcB family protein [candidate division FCPU426 bacterium]
MDCRECYELLPLYVDHNLSASEISEIKAHLELCQPCSQEFAKLEATVNMVCGLSCVEAPSDFHQRFMARFNRECKPSRSWNMWGTMALSTAAAAMVLLMVVVFYNPLPPITVASRDSHLAKPKATSPTQAPEPELAAAKMDAQPQNAEQAARSSNEDSRAALEEALSLPAPAAPREAARRSAGLSPLITAVDFPGGGALASRKREAAPAADQAAPLVRWSGEWSGDTSLVQEPVNKVLRSSEALQELWKTAGLKSLAMPEVDWRREMIGAIFLGQQPTGGYEIQLKELQRNPNALEVKYAVRSPQDAAAGRPTSPFLIFRLPATPAPVQFTEE